MSYFYFKTEWEILPFLKKQESFWITCKTNRKHLSFQTRKEPTAATSLEALQTYRRSEKWGIQVAIEEIPYQIEPFAMTSIFQAFGISGSILEHFTPTDLRIVLNKCVKYKKTGKLYFKVTNGLISHCGTHKTEEWNTLFQNVKEHASQSRVSFFYGEFQNGTLTLTYKGQEQQFEYRISELHGLSIKEKKERKRNV